jgi:hypothetical protein
MEPTGGPAILPKKYRNNSYRRELYINR